MNSISCMPQSMQTVQYPVLHVEARVKSNGDGIIVRTDLVLIIFNNCCRQTTDIIQLRDEVANWLIENFAILSLRQEIYSFGTLLVNLQDLQANA